MTLQSMERGKNIQSRIKELNTMKLWVRDKQGVNASVIANGHNISDAIPMSDDMRDMLVKKCDEEIEQFMKEFREL